jgi:formate/nitrite transporter FocA (FNT family)
MDGMRTRSAGAEATAMWVQIVGQYSLAIPAALMLVAGFLLAIRSVDARPGSLRGVRQLAGNLTYTVGLVGLCVAVLLLVQKLIGYNLNIP